MHIISARYVEEEYATHSNSDSIEIMPLKYSNANEV